MTNKKIDEMDVTSLEFEPPADPTFHDRGWGTSRPYWQPSEKKGSKGHHGAFRAKVVDFDDADPKFKKWVFQATHKTLCYVGSEGKENYRSLVLEPGDYFTTSAYTELRLHPYIGHVVEIVSVGKDTKVSENPMWRFQLRTTDATDAALGSSPISSVLTQNSAKHLDAPRA